MECEFDETKSSTNKDKHGIDFLETQALWRDPDRLEVAARTSGEPRWQVIGTMRRTLWSVFVTYRHERIRIISVRRARPEEKARYSAQ